MSNGWDLKRLRDKPTRDEILKAELAALLHDVGKFTTAHLEHSSDGGSFSWPCDHSYKIVVDEPQNFLQISSSAASVKKPAVLNEISSPNCTSPNSKKAADFLPDKLKQWIKGENINIGAEIYNLPEILILGVPGFTTSPHRAILLNQKDGWLIALLGLNHHIAHHEKPEFKIDLIPQKYPKVRLDTPFGFSFYSINLTSAKVEDCLEKAIVPFFNSDLKRAKENLRKCFNHGWGDTRYPLNEVNLESWSLIVASLFKAQIAYFSLSKHKVCIGQWRSWKDKIIDTTATWRLLSIRTNGLEYLLSAPSIPDLKTRQELLQDAWNRVQHLLEEEYPLALEVYRDENGPVFVVPDINNLLELTDSDRNGKTLREFILERFRQGTVQNDPHLALEGEAIPEFADEKPWDGQSILPPIGDHLGKEPILQVDPHWVAVRWRNLTKLQERCTVCGLRPQGPSPKAKRRGRCDVCEKRRTGRAERWASQELHTTIWLDEVADRHGRVALLVGSFDLNPWLDGTLVRSLAVRNPEKVPDRTQTEKITKNPSFARLRRIWETTRKFWEEALKDTEQGLGKRSRILLKGTLQKGSLGPYHAYELEIQDRKVAVLWVPEDAEDEEGNALEHRGGFWVIENLDYLDNVYGRSFRKIVHELAGQTLKVYEPTEYGRPGREQATFTIAREDGVQDAATRYTPLIPILAEPRTFMALVPADKAFEVVKAIKTKYEREMGRVRNRLPLHLGIVFADSHQPLRTILDAGRRMLKRPSPVLIGKVQNVKRFGQPNHPNETKGWRALRLLRRADLLKHQQNQFRVLIGVRIEDVGDEQTHRDFIWYVPAVMGNGQTEDHWYPYVFWVQDKEGNTNPVNATEKRGRYYQAPNPFNPNEEGNPQLGWLVHAGELQRGDRIYFTPATFDFIFLDHSGKRFEIAYDDKGLRLGASNRPYLLDKLEDLEACWSLLTNGKRHAQDQGKPAWRLSSRQIHQIRDAIEQKREEWFSNFKGSQDDDTFKRFCRDLLANAEWKVKPSNDELDRLAQWAVNGVLTDAIELFLHIMKQRENAAEQTKEGEAEE